MRKIAALIALAFAALPLAFAVLLLASVYCQPGELTLKEYSYKLEAILEEDRVRTEEAQGDVGIWGGGGYGYSLFCCGTDAARDFMDAIVTIHGDTLAAVQKLDPPAEAQAAHDEFVAVMDALVVTGKDVRDIVSEAESTEEFHRLAPPELGGQYHDLSHRRSEACYALVNIAAQSNIDIDMYRLCPGFD
ncbi:MAG: hypothetical protein Q7R32_01095 [Dehalococcoidia bacterium]|nr:hypothetical protein [Dehalococcoidia bacterium]